MKNINYFTLLMAICITLLTACSSYKNVPYFQDVKYSTNAVETIENFKPITIQPADILSVSVSNLNPQAYNDSTGRTVGYSVDKDGNIKLPLIGSIKVNGLTTTTAEQQIQDKLEPFLKNADVVVRIKNFKVSVMGDVARPDVYNVVSERVTITEALTMAGDLNITAKRSQILLVREVDGKREYVPIDLLSSNLFRSPYFYLKNNDMLYVQPDKTKYAAVDGSYRTFSLVLSALSVVAIVLTSVIK